ncbi:electron transfer flavoprotein subunit alpha/FixB family protein [Pelagibacterium sediminicola]|uniref:electron transfer flavoprotein subunit alpha/FixB family protein n=1 Tax=Pelagibacterium sediminicola TaxID=2248761 RepID=UPI000E322506|nr:electron transfer flavoprotein subunit alpha/FixB family protein [Pelagibacterium sediminicola]
MTTLILAEHDNTALLGATARTVAAAKNIGAPIHVLITGHGVSAAANAAAKLDGVEKVLVADHESLAHGAAEPVSEAILAIAAAYEHIAAPATTFGKSAMPRVAALLGVMQVSDVTKILSPSSFERPVYAGAAIETVEATADKVVFTVRTSAFDGVAETGSASIEPVGFSPTARTSRFVSRESAAGGGGVDLSSAKVVVSGGRALGSAEQFTEILTPLAEKLGAALGASRAAVDAGYAPNDWQIGQTGKVVAPDLYIAIGISGAIQHLAGMKNSKVIVAIDKDPEAPIFSVADYGLVADIFEAVPELTKAL